VKFLARQQSVGANALDKLKFVEHTDWSLSTNKVELDESRSTLSVSFFLDDLLRACKKGRPSGPPELPLGVAGADAEGCLFLKERR